MKSPKFNSCPGSYSNILFLSSTFGFFFLSPSLASPSFFSPSLASPSFFSPSLVSPSFFSPSLASPSLVSVLGYSLAAGFYSAGLFVSDNNLLLPNKFSEGGITLVNKDLLSPPSNFSILTFKKLKR